MVEIESLIAAAAALAIAFGGYVQFVLRRSIYPCIEFDVELTCLPPEPVRQEADPAAPAPGPGERVAELVLLLRNVGPGVGFVDNVQGRVGCRRANESGAGPDGLEPALSFFLQPPPGSAVGSRGRHWFLVAPRARGNFIQPDVTQRYRKPLLLPGDASIVHVWGAFDYRIEVGRVTWFLARLFSQRPQEQIVDYTVRRTFPVTMLPPVP